MYQPHSIVLNTRMLLVMRYDGRDYESSRDVPWSIALNPLRYSFTLWPATPRHKSLRMPKFRKTWPMT